MHNNRLIIGPCRDDRLAEERQDSHKPHLAHLETDTKNIDLVSNQPYRDAQDKLPWRHRTCPAYT